MSIHRISNVVNHIEGNGQTCDKHDSGEGRGSAHHHTRSFHLSIVNHSMQNYVISVAIVDITNISLVSR